MPLPMLMTTLVPIFLLILLGQGLYRGGFPGEAFWWQAERLTYFVLFPCLLVQRLATANLTPYRDYALIITLALGLLSVVLWAAAYGLKLNSRRFAVVYQGASRFNTYIALALASALYGSPGVALMALIIAIEMPLVNILAIILLRRGQGAVTPLALLRSVFSNPLIIAAIVGLAINLSGVHLPQALSQTADILARAALPLGLLTVGAGLQLAAIREPGAIALALLAKLLVFPLLVYGMAQSFALGTLEQGALVLFHAVPAAPSAYILTRQLGGDAPLMAAILTLQVLASMISLPFMLAML